MTTIKKQRGGKREGAGRPRGEPSITLSYRVPEKHSEVIDRYIKNLIKNYKNEKSNSTTNRKAKTGANDHRYYNFISNLSDRG